MVRKGGKTEAQGKKDDDDLSLPVSRAHAHTTAAAAFQSGRASPRQSSTPRAHRHHPKPPSGPGPSGVLAFEMDGPSPADPETVELLLDDGPDGPHMPSASHGANGHSANSHGAPATKCGVVKTLANIFISFVGAGILGLPYAFMRSGIVLGAAFMVGLSALAYYCILLLVACKQRLEHKGVVTYSQVAEAALGRAGKLLVEVLLVLSQTGFCVAYLIFISTNLAPLLPISKAVIVLTVLPLQVCLAMLQDLSALAPFSLLADAAHVVGMLVVLKDDVQNYTAAHETVVASKGITAVPFLFGVVIYCYEGIGMILPIEDAMRDKSKFRATLSLGFGIITTVFLIFGAIGYAAFGEATRDIITENLPPDWTTETVKIALCCALFFTFPIMLVPVYEIVERGVQALPAFDRAVAPHRRAPVLRLLRTTVVGCIGLVAISVPGFGAFISFIGSFCCASLAFIIPATCHLVLFNDKITRVAAAMDYFLLAVGLVGMVFGVAQSLPGLIHGVAGPHG